MADIELVIKISERMYNFIKTHFRIENEVDMAILNGTPLPKGHGRLIDADELLKHKHTIGTSNYCEYNVVYVETIKEAPIIIEADKAESEK